MTDPITTDPTAGRDTKQCNAPGCDVRMVRPKKLSKTRWDQARYCSRACTGRALSTKLLKTYDESRPCAYSGCDVVLHRKDGEAPARWATRRYCSRSCSARGTAPPARLGSKVCALEGCEVVFERRRGYSDVEWAKRRFCTAAHASASRKVEHPVRERKASVPRVRRVTPRAAPAASVEPVAPPVPVPPPIRPPWLLDFGNGLSRLTG